MKVALCEEFLGLEPGYDRKTLDKAFRALSLKYDCAQETIYPERNDRMDERKEHGGVTLPP